MQKRKPDNRDDVTRMFWALFLNAEVAADGQVPGFRVAWERMDRKLRQWAERIEEACWLKIQRGRQPEEVIAAGVLAFREVLEAYEPPPPRSSPEYTKFRLDLIHKILDDGLRPFEVAALLEQAVDRFPDEPLAEEIDRYRGWHDRWPDDHPGERWKPSDQQRRVIYDLITPRRPVPRIDNSPPDELWWASKGPEILKGLGYGEASHASDDQQKP